MVNPERGMSVTAFFARRGDDWLAIMPDTRDETSSLASASFLLMPYSNRVEDGRFVFEGKKYQLAKAEKHALHGDVRFRNWRTIKITRDYIRCGFDSTSFPDMNWPWPFTAEVEYRLEGDILSSRLLLQNRSDSAMPAGLGWHPYFNRKITRKGEPVILCLKVGAVYPDANNNRIPSGPPQPLTPQQDFSESKPLDPDYSLDTCFQGYDGNGWIAWPESGVKVSFNCSPVCTHLVMYNPSGKPYFAVEPVTNANNGVNIYSRGEPGSGIVVLKPGESLRAEFDLRVETNS
jgi:aldose 1-epimerase